MSSGYGHAAFVALALPMLACAQNPGSGDADLAAARAALWDSHGAQINYLLISERFEYQSNGGDALGVWEAQGWVGGDINKLWLKTEGEFESEDSELEEAEAAQKQVHAFWAEVFASYDFAVLPVAPCPAPILGEATELREAHLRLTTPGSLGQVPILTIPYFMDSGLSGGLQIIVPDLSESSLSIWRYLLDG